MHREPIQTFIGKKFVLRYQIQDSTMKTTLIAVILTIISLQSKAQLKGFSIGPYAEMGWPTGKLDETNKNGIGAGLNADIRLGKIGLTGSVGYMHFAGKTVVVNESAVDMPDINAIPVRVGIKYRLIPVLYAKLEGGVAKSTNGNNSPFIISPGIGLRLLGFDVQAKYETWMNDGNSSFWGLKVGFNF